MYRKAPCPKKSMVQRSLLYALLAARARPQTAKPPVQQAPPQHTDTTAPSPWQPAIHFSAAPNWINDPNGPIFLDGQYHLFFQFNPFGDQWGHMSWGHAVSTNLLDWQELPVAIPEKDGEMAFTGSVVVDRENTSGFCAPGAEGLVMGN